MNVLSLFDGMSCGQLALNRLGIEYDTYYASEIDKYAIKVTQANFPNTIQVGDVTQVKADDFKGVKIDLILAGSPCQGFSKAGKQLNFDDPRSKLFFEFIRLVKELQPKYFLLENVNMKKESRDIITKYTGVEPIDINSSLLSAQNRRRLYWTNIPNVTQPEDKGIVLKDILDVGDGQGTATLKRFNLDSTCHHVADADDINGHDSLKRVYGEHGKSPTVNSAQGGNRQPKVLVENKSATKNDKAYSLTASYNGAVAWNSIERKQRTMIPISQCDDDDPNVVDGYRYRKLTPVECERLQTVPDNYTNHVSNSQRYKMLGNGWTIDVIAHILKNMDVVK